MARSTPPGPSAGGKPDKPTFSPPIEDIVSILEAARSRMSPASRTIADYILGHREGVVRMSITELADAVDLSESAVVQFCKRVGATGFQQFRLSLARDVVKPVQFIHEDLATSDDVSTVNNKIFHANLQALQDTLQVIKASEMTRARDLILAAERVEVYGIGSAAPIAEDAQYRMKRIGLNAVVEVDSHKQAISAALTGPTVAVLTVSHSGSTHETLTATRLAREAGAKTICITNIGRSPIYRYADVVLQTVARETQFRTEAMTSRIAQLSIVDALIANLALASYDRSVKTIAHTFDVLSAKRF
jgi:DNA-binding MurR/RpiR family transcriptional regulator